MNHLHFCDIAGHEWQCKGAALRPDAGDMEPSVCMCMMHGVPMGDGDHSQCPAELLACSAHSAGQRGDQRGEALLGANVFAEALQIMLNSAGRVDDSDCVTELEGEQ